MLQIGNVHNWWITKTPRKGLCPSRSFSKTAFESAKPLISQVMYSRLCQSMLICCILLFFAQGSR